MASDRQYVKKIRRYGWGDLRKLWVAISHGNTPGWDSGKALEYLVLRAFELSGTEVVWPYNVSSEGKTIEQIDGVIYLDGLAALMECKDYDKSVNFEPIAKLRQQLARRPPATIGCCFALNGFTEEAVLLAQRNSPQNVLLWHGDEIEFALGKKKLRQGLIAKYRHSVEHALPDFKINI
jgi:Restriction endonuclease